jgi:hypothetical protein
VTIVKTELSGVVFPNRQQHGFTCLELDRFFSSCNLLILQSGQCRQKPQKQGLGTKSVQNFANLLEPNPGQRFPLSLREMARLRFTISHSDVNPSRQAPSVRRHKDCL